MSHPSSAPSSASGFHDGIVAGLAAIGLVLAFALRLLLACWPVIGLAVKERAETAQLVSTLPLLIFIFASSLAVPVNTMPGWLEDFTRRPSP